MFIKFTKEGLLKGKKWEDLSPELQVNFNELLEKINLVGDAYGKPLIATSVVRLMSEHLEIYRKKGITDQTKIPMKSKHLYALAVDVADASGEFNMWCKANVEILKNIGIWLEVRQGNWQHCQIRPYGSYREGKPIWFNP